jgi:hypothetical protein
MAGKTGKCPKCQQPLKVPAGASQAAPAAVSPSAGPGTQVASAKAAPAKASPTKPPAAQVPPDKAARGKVPPAKAAPDKAKAMDDFFESAGLVKQIGAICPGCNAPVAPGAAICVKCGLNFESGEKMKGFETELALSEFDNLHLNEAAKMMEREKEVEKVQDAAGTPWWVMLCYLFGAMMLVATGVIIIDGKTNEPKAIDYRFVGIPIGQIQRMAILKVLVGTVAIISGMTIFFAHLAVSIFGFSQKWRHGFGSLLVPLYAPIYGLTRFGRLKGTVISYWVALVVCIAATIYVNR